MSIDPLANAMDLAHQAQAADDAASLSRKGVGKGKDMADAAQAFESYMVELMIREMRKTIPEGMFQNSTVEMFGGILDQEISNRIAETGGLGFGALLTQNADSVLAAHDLGRAEPLRMVPRDGSTMAGSPRGRGVLPVRNGIFTSPFGTRSDPFHGRARKHKGVDIAAFKGSPIHPVKPGTVVSAGKRGSYGNVVVVDHGDGTTSLYAHCDELKVSKGQMVGRDDTIATVGSTGRSTGPHLHLEVHRDGRAVDPMEELGWSHTFRQSVARR